MIFQRLICKAIYYLQQLIAAHNTLLSKISNDLGLTDEQEKDRDRTEIKVEKQRKQAFTGA